jgi:hypothetical protein
MQILKLLLKIGGWFMVAIAIIVLTASFFLYRHTHNFVQSASHAQGTVTKMVEKPGHDSGTVYYPVYTFQDSRGKQHEIYSSGGSYPPAYKVGDTVPVLYQPDKPENAEIDDFLNVWFFTAMLAGFGLVDLVFGLGLFAVGVIVGVIVRRIEHRPPIYLCHLTNRCRQRGMALSVPLRGSRWLAPRA